MSGAPSVEPSSTTINSQASTVWARALSTAAPTKVAWLYVGMIAVTIGRPVIWCIMREALTGPQAQGGWRDRGRYDGSDADAGGAESDCTRATHPGRFRLHPDLQRCALDTRGDRIRARAGLLRSRGRR